MNLTPFQRPGPAAHPAGAGEDRIFDLSLIVPVYLNEANIPDLLEALASLAKKLSGRLELVFVVDGSPDRSYELLSEALPSFAIPAQLLALSRNFGAFAAIRVGIEVARGNLIGVMAADLQEPPELFASFFDLLSRGEADVVFGVREGREDGFFSQLCSNLFWSLYRRLVIAEIPKGGIDIFACNVQVKQAVLQISEPNSSLIAQLIWVGFRKKFIPYARRKRAKGKSAWKFGRKFRYMLDSLFSFSDLPVLLLLWLGAAGLLVSTLLGLITFVAKLAGAIKVPGYTALILVQLFFFSLLLLSQGIIGSYLWRTFENTKRRPLTLVRLHSCFDSQTDARNSK